MCKAGHLCLTNAFLPLLWNKRSNQIQEKALGFVTSQPHASRGQGVIERKRESRRSVDVSNVGISFFMACGCPKVGR